MKHVYRGLGYFVFSVCYLLVVIFGEKIQSYYKLQAGRTANPYPYMFIMALFPFVIGFIIGIPLFIRNINARGKWKIDWIRLMIIGLPTLILGALPAMIYSQTLALIIHSSFPRASLLIKPEIIVMSGIMFGFTLINSIEKVDSGNVT